MNSTMMAFCGTYCDACTYKERVGCGGCQAQRSEMFWGICDKAACCMERGFSHCGHCPELPCQRMIDLFADPEHGDEGARMENLKAWAGGNLTYQKLR